MQNTKISGLTNNCLKIIAMVSMLIDHVGLMIFPEYKFLRIIGRIAFPIFAYMIAEGCFHTRNRTKYLSLIAVLGIACQTVYTIAGHSLIQNILITFSLSISIIFATDNYLNKKDKKSFLIMTAVVLSAIFISAVAPVLFKNEGFRIDYGFTGMILPVVIYYSRTKTIKIISACLVLGAMAFLNENQIFAFMALPFLLLYNGERGKLNMKYFFYIFYPSHLALIYLIDKII